MPTAKRPPAKPPPPPPKPAPKPAARPAPAPAPRPAPKADPKPAPAAKAAPAARERAPATGSAGRPLAGKPAAGKPTPAGSHAAKPPGKAASQGKPKATSPARRPGSTAPAAKPGKAAPKQAKGKASPKPKSNPKAKAASVPTAGGGGSSVSLGKFESTAYGPPWNAEQGTGVTATGIDLRPAKQAYIIAVDPSVIRLHSHVHVVPNPFGDNNIVFRAEDTGGAIKGRHIDVYDWRGRSHQLGWGVRQVEVTTAQGEGAGDTTPPGGGGTGRSGATNVYHNPLAHARVTAERIDQGVDYAGTGWLAAIADGVVTTVHGPSDSGWPGSFIEYKITQPGQLEGAYVYYAEGVTANVSPGDHLNGGDKVATLIPNWHSGIEIGFGAGTGGESYYRYHDGPYQEGTATRPGIAFSNLVKLLGGPPGRIEGATVGKWPEYVQQGSYQGVTDSGVLPASGGGIEFTAGDAQAEANSVDWGGSVKRKWHALQSGGYTGAHHSGSASAFAASKEYLTI